MPVINIDKLIRYNNKINKSKGWDNDKKFLSELKSMGVNDIKFDQSLVQFQFPKNLSPYMLFYIIKKMTTYETSNPLEKITFRNNKLTMPIGFLGFQFQDFKQAYYLKD